MIWNFGIQRITIYPTTNEEVPVDEKDLSRLVKDLLIPILFGIVSTAETTNPKQKKSQHPFR